MRVKRVKHQRLYEDVIEQIEGALKSGELQPGDMLPPERELSETFGVSRGTLREAFRILEREGVIESQQGGGRYVRKITNNFGHIFSNMEKAEIFDWLETREILESEIVALASIRASEQDLKDIERILKKSKYAEDIENVYSSDQAFHLAVAEATNNIVLINMIELNLDMLNKIRQQTTRLPGRSQEMFQEHMAILEEIQNRNPQAAKEALLHHLRRIRTAIEARSEQTL